jgi:hypothetical protein
MKTFLTGNHRSVNLAERHRREIERNNPGTTVEITWRRDASGRFSNRGTRFTFSIDEEKKVDTLEQFWDEFDDAESFVDDEFGSRPEYGEE